MSQVLTFIKTRSAFFWVGIAVFTTLILAASFLKFDATRISNWFENLSGSSFAIPMILLAYVIGAFISIPQWMLHGGAVLVFGPVTGSFMAWTATMISACFDFGLARQLGHGRVSKMTGDLVGRFMEMIQKHGFWTSLIVRIVPTGPFIVVNMAAGVTGMRFSSFALGTMIGILPKIITVAFFGEGIQAVLSGQGVWTIAGIVGLGLLWIGAMVFAKRKLQSRSASNQI